MGCISKIINCTSYTSTEKKLKDYILKHREDVIYDTAQTLADKVSVSPAAIIRFSKKLGYQGFTELKVDLAMDQDYPDSENTFSGPIENEDSLEMIIKKERASTLATVENTYNMMHVSALQTAITKLKSARKIYLFGIGASGICCMDFTQKLSRIGYNVIYNTDPHMLLACSSYITAADVALGISSRGYTREVIAAMRHAKEKGAFTIAITQSNNSPLHKLAECLLLLPQCENELRLGALDSRSATLIYTDLLYLGIIADNLEVYKQQLKYTRTVVKSIYD